MRRSSSFWLSDFWYSGFWSRHPAEQIVLDDTEGATDGAKPRHVDAGIERDLDRPGTGRGLHDGPPDQVALVYGRAHRPFIFDAHTHPRLLAHGHGSGHRPGGDQRHLGRLAEPDVGVRDRLAGPERHLGAELAEAPLDQ